MALDRYDNRSGVWGLENGPCIGLLPPNLSLGGVLAPNASGPSITGVFINGRQIHAPDAAQLQALGIVCIPGRWWVNADGTYGIEGNMVPWGNLRMQAMASKRTPSHSGYGSWSFGGSDGQGFNYVGGHDSTDGSGYFSSSLPPVLRFLGTVLSQAMKLGHCSSTVIVCYTEAEESASLSEVGSYFVLQCPPMITKDITELILAKHDL